MQPLLVLRAYLCPHTPQITVPLSAIGVVVEPHLEEQVQIIIDFIDNCVAIGTLEPVGPGKSARNRLRAFQNKLYATGDLIEAGELEEACEKLASIRAKVDGMHPPPDWLKGDDATELLQQIDDLMNTIRCE